MAWLKSLFVQKPESGSVAKNRLQMVLTHDRGEIPPGLLDEIRDDIIAILAKRLSLDPTSVVVQLNHTERKSCLIAEIPLQGTTVRRRR